MSERPTPETDAARITEKNGCIATFGVSQVVSVNFARKLERERDEAIRLLKECAEYALTTHQDQVEEFLKKIK